MRRAFRSRVSILAAAVVAGSAAGVAGGAEPAALGVTFTRAIGNVETAAVGMQIAPPATVRKAPEAAGAAWYGTIMRRLPGDGPRAAGHYVPFLAEYGGRSASRAWCDSNFNGDLTDDPALRLSPYPAIDGARSFLTDLRWNTTAGSREIQVEWKLRVVLEPLSSSGLPPIYRVQTVYAMMGDVRVDGRAHKAFLHDGNGDGIYTVDAAAHDGIYVDFDDDLRFYVSEHSPEFSAFAKRIQIGPRFYDVVSVDPDGRDLVLRQHGAAEWTPPPGVGRPAPPFSFKDGAGQEIRLGDFTGRFVAVYFWGSWCRTCAVQADAIKRLHDTYHPAGLEILGVSFDTDRAAMESFRKEHGHTWPTSFSGFQGREDPIGRLYWAYGAGLVYLVDRDGRLEGIYEDLDRLADRLQTLIPAAAAAAH